MPSLLPRCLPAISLTVLLCAELHAQAPAPVQLPQPGRAPSVMEAPSKDLSTYPELEYIQLGVFGGDIVVAPEIDLTARRAGKFEWLVADGERVKAGDTLAYLSVESLNLTLKRVELAERQAELQRLDLRNQSRDQRTSLSLQLAELELQALRLDVSEAEKDLLGAKLLAKLGKEKSRVDAELKLLSERLDSDYFDTRLRLELENIDLDLQGRRSDYEAQKLNASIIAPEDGVVIILEPNGKAAISDVLGKLKRVDFAEMSIALPDPRVQAVPTDELKVLVHRPDGKYQDAEFIEKEVGLQSRNGVQTYRFKLLPDPDGSIPEELNGSHLVTFGRAFPEPVRIVAKTPFLFHFTEELQNQGWNRLLRQHFGQTLRVHYIGPRQIAVTLPESP